MTARKLMALTLQRRSVVWMSGRPIPAAFVVGMPFRFIMGWLPRLKTYQPKKKR